jgi:hypothetical protein
MPFRRAARCAETYVQIHRRASARYGAFPCKICTIFTLRNVHYVVREVRVIQKEAVRYAGVPACFQITLLLKRAPNPYIWLSERQHRQH